MKFTKSGIVKKIKFLTFLEMHANIKNRRSVIRKLF